MLGNNNADAICKKNDNYYFFIYHVHPVNNNKRIRFRIEQASLKQLVSITIPACAKNKMLVLHYYFPSSIV